MRTKLFNKTLAAFLALVMILSVMAILPISAYVAEDDTLAVAELTPYDMADDGDLLYRVNFNGDTAFQPDRYLGWVGNQILGDTTQYIVSADGSELHIQGDDTLNSSRFHWWGGTIEGLEAGEDKFYTMVYKAKPLDRYGYSLGMNNSFSVGGWSADPDSCLNYTNYGNYSSIERDADGNPMYDTDSDTRRMRMNIQQTGIGKIYTSGRWSQPDNTYFKDLEKADTEIQESRPLIDEDGYMTTMIEYDAPNNEIRTYYLVKGTGQDKSDWQQVQKAEFAHASMNPDLSDDYIGYWSFCSYHIVNVSVKDVCYYRGAYYQTVPLITIETPEDLAALHETVNSVDYATNSKLRIRLADDIDMTDVAYMPVWTEKAIQFNGNGYTIAGLAVGTENEPEYEAGLFARAGAGSTFRNLRLLGGEFYGVDYAGSLLAYAAAGDLTISNVWAFSCGVVATDGPAGGLVGSNARPTEIAVWDFSYCLNTSDVLSNDSTGGLIGKADGSIDLNVSYCANTGNICSQVVVGGLANQTAGTDGSASFDHCVNSGILGSNDAGFLMMVGGILGLAYDIPEMSFYNCYDLSIRTTMQPTSWNGAFLGYVGGTTDEISFENCYGAILRAEDVITEQLNDDWVQYEALIGSDSTIATRVNSGVASSSAERITLSTGTITFNDMLQRLLMAIMFAEEVEMPLGGFDDGMERDYTWFYEDGAFVEKGTKNNPYEICNEAQFAALSALTNGHQDSSEVGGIWSRVDFDGAYFKLLVDIDLEDYDCAPLNMEEATIFFDGNGKTISNWEIDTTSSAGMFSALGKNSTVQNLTLDQVSFYAEETSGYVVAEAMAGLTVYNVTVSENCSLNTNGEIAGGIVGAIVDDTATPDDEDTVTIIYCVNNGSVVASKTVGGIVGAICANVNYQISYCANTGVLFAMSVDKDDESYILGGILGTTERGGNTATEYFESHIKYCYNTAALWTGGTTELSYVGGIVGYLNAPDYSEVEIIRCYDLSARDVDDDALNAGIGAGSGNKVVKFVDYCYAANAVNSEDPFYHLVTWKNDVNSQVDFDSTLVINENTQILIAKGMYSTIGNEMQKIDAAIASLGEMVDEVPEDNQPEGNQPENNQPENNQPENNQPENNQPENNQPENNQPENNQPEDNQPEENEPEETKPVETEKPAETTKPADTTKPAETTKSAETTTAGVPDMVGCGSSIVSPWSVILLVAILPMMFFRKKKENE